MILRPVGSKIVVRQDEGKDVSAGGIVLVREEVEFRGEVIATGDGILLRNGDVKSLPVNTGDRVIFTRNGGTEVKDTSGAKFLIMDISSVLAVIEED